MATIKQSSSESAERFSSLLGLGAPPVALAFRDSPPADVAKVSTAGPSGCSYWKRAADGEVFYTEASDHYHCPIGAHTHGVDLPPAQMKELEEVVGTMVSLGYIRSEEVPGIPRRDGKFGVAVYAPMSAAPFEPDVVIVRGNAKQMMLLMEAATAAGIGSDGAMMGRPTCAAVPEAMRSGRSVASLGCIGNRVYTGLADDELYLVLPGSRVNVVAEKLSTILNANRELERYHLARAS